MVAQKCNVRKGKQNFVFVVDSVRFFGNPYIPKEIQRAIKPDGTVCPENIVGVAVLAANREIMLVVIEYNGRQDFVPLTNFRHTPPPQKLQKIIAEKGVKNGRYITAKL